MKKIINSIFLLIVISTGLASCGNKSAGNQSTAIDSLSQRNDIEKVTGIGKVEPLSGLVDLASDEGGIIESINKKEGDSLKKGEIILSFDSKKEAIQLQNLKIQIATQKQRVEQDRANEKQYEIALREKSADLKVSEELAQSGAETRQQVETLRKERDVLKANLEAAQKSTATNRLIIQELENEIEQTESSRANKLITAPDNGVLLSLNAEIGKAVEAFVSIGQFAADEPLIIHGEVDELFSDKIKVGQTVSIHLIGNNEKIASGEIISLSPILQDKSLFYDEPGERNDRRVRRFKASLDEEASLLINKKVACVIEL